MRPLSDADIERRFTYHRPEGQKVADHEDMRLLLKGVARLLNDSIPGPSREASLAFTAHEEATF